MPSPPKGVLDDELKQLSINDMSGGLVTAIGALSVGPNQTPDSLNVFAYNGKLQFRGGYKQFSDLPSQADVDFTYTDNLGIQHIMVWSGGSLYDCRTGSPVLVAAAVYTAGQQVGHCVLNAKMYWCTLTVPLREYDGTTEQAVPNSGGPGVIPPPAANFLVTYAGSIVAIYPVPLGTPEPSSFMWSDVNDPTTWFSSAIQTVGSNDGSICTFALLMGVIPGGVASAGGGVPATRQLLVGKNRENLFLYQGALGTLTENAIPTPVGSIDPNSAVYIPTKEGLGAVMFLGDDFQMYLTNGNSAVVASENIQDLVYNLTSAALVLNRAQKFNATYNINGQYYIIDFGQNTQLAYKWDTNAWWLFQGWPSGPYVTAFNSSGLLQLYVAAQSAGVTGLYNIGLAQTNDNGSNINAYYTTPYLHGGSPQIQKRFARLTMAMQNVGIRYLLTVSTDVRADNTTQNSFGALMDDPAYDGSSVVAGEMIWDVTNWDEAIWGGGSNMGSLAQPYGLAFRNTRLFALSTPTIWEPTKTGKPVPLMGAAAQVRIAWNGGIYDFRLVGLSLGMLFRGIGFVGNNRFETEGQQQ